jgi:hypothetical protein
VNIVEQTLRVTTPNGRTVEFEGDRAFGATGLGGSGGAQGGAVFVGYGLEDGPNGYTNFPEGSADVEGKVAVLFRFEPVAENGGSAWANGGRWTDAASFNNKLGAVASRGAAAAIIINPPGTRDPRAERLLRPGVGGSEWDMPVLHMTVEGGAELMAALAGEERSLEEWRALADDAATAGAVELPGSIALSAELEVEPLRAYNVGGLLRGKGALADEVVVVGAHFDHTGDGGFGEPRDVESTHNGADDNASGTAGVLLLAERLVKRYAELGEDAEARSVLFIGFDAEESGLNGAVHYVRNPIMPIDQHQLMVNFDMIGRVTDRGLSVTGVGTAEGMFEWLRPHFADSGLDVRTPTNVSRRSDHAPFYFSGNVPVLFAIITPLHDDYHTAADESWKINRVDAVRVVDLFEGVVMEAATKAERLQVIPAASPPPASRVLVGVLPTMPEDESGVIFQQVTPGSAADKAGVRSGDRLIEWDGEPVDTLNEWRWALSEHTPGDEVELTVVRDGEEIRLTITLRSR